MVDDPPAMPVVAPGHTRKELRFQMSHKARKIIREQGECFSVRVMGDGLTDAVSESVKQSQVRKFHLCFRASAARGAVSSFYFRAPYVVFSGGTGSLEDQSFMFFVIALGVHFSLSFIAFVPAFVAKGDLLRMRGIPAAVIVFVALTAPPRFTIRKSLIITKQISRF